MTDPARTVRIMGILNLNGDSFYAPSRYNMSVMDAGPDIVDIGAVSTRPGAGEVSEEDEWSRLKPVLRTLDTGVAVSIDTTRAGIIERACDLLGRPVIVNDISAGEDDPAMLSTVGQLGLEYIAMHKRGTPATMQSLCDYDDVVGEVEEYFRGFALKAEENDLGIKGGIKVKWRENDCISCGVCEKACRVGAVAIADGKISVDDAKCNFCGRCVKSCPTEAWDSQSGYIVSFGGLFGNTIAKGEPIIPFIEDKEKLLEICDAAIRFFEDNANAGERFKFAIDRVGRDKFKEVILEAYNG